MSSLSEKDGVKKATPEVSPVIIAPKIQTEDPLASYTAVNNPIVSTEIKVESPAVVDPLSE